MDAGDAASRLGVDMGEPAIKAAELRFMLETFDADTLVKQAALAGLAMRGLAGGAKMIGRGASKLFGGVNRLGKKSRGWFKQRKANQTAPTSRFGKTMNVAGHGFDMMDVGLATTAVAAPTAATLAYQKNRTGGVI
jgi:hypothetical protein